MALCVRYLWALGLIALIPNVSSALVPTGPGPLDIFRVGEFCSINWTPDYSSTWTNVTINLMSGPNDNMNWVATVVQGLDGSDATLVPYNWTCPDVHPYGPIYFYQFTQEGQPAQWTTRFTISSASGETEPAEHINQPNGAQVAWGTGHAEAAASAVGAAGSPGSQSGSGNGAGAPATGASGPAGVAHHEAGVDSADVDTIPSDGSSVNGAQGHAAGVDQYGSSNATATSSRRPRPSRLSSAVPTIPLPSNFQEMLDDYNQYASRSGRSQDVHVQRLVVPLICAFVLVLQ